MARRIKSRLPFTCTRLELERFHQLLQMLPWKSVFASVLFRSEAHRRKAHVALVTAAPAKAAVKISRFVWTTFHTKSWYLAFRQVNKQRLFGVSNENINLRKVFSDLIDIFELATKTLLIRLLATKGGLLKKCRQNSYYWNSSYKYTKSSSYHIT